MEAIAIFYMCSRSTTSKDSPFNNYWAQRILENELEMAEFMFSLKMPDLDFKYEEPEDERGIRIGLIGARGFRGHLAAVMIAHDVHFMGTSMTLTDSLPEPKGITLGYSKYLNIETEYNPKPWEQTGRFDKFTKDRRKRY